MQVKQNNQTKYPTQTEIQTALVETDDLIASLNKNTTDYDRFVARCDNYGKMIDDLLQHSNIGKHKTEELLTALFVDVENEAAGGADEQSPSKEEILIANCMKSLLRNAHKHGLDERSMQIIQNAANIDRRLSVENNSFKLPQAFRIQVRVMSIQALKGVAIIALYMGLFFVLYKIFV